MPCFVICDRTVAQCTLSLLLTFAPDPAYNELIVVVVNDVMDADTSVSMSISSINNLLLSLSRA